MRAPGVSGQVLQGIMGAAVDAQFKVQMGTRALARAPMVAM